MNNSFTLARETGGRGEVHVQLISAAKSERERGATPQRRNEARHGSPLSRREGPAMQRRRR